MFGFLKRPEDVQNEFVAVERGKSPTNPDYMQRLFCFFFFKEVSLESQSLANGRDGGFHLFYLFSWPLMLFPRGCLPLGQQYHPLNGKPDLGFWFLISPEPVDVWPPLA